MDPVKGGTLAPPPPFNAHSLLPAGSPLEMPVQDLRLHTRAVARDALTWSRATLLLLAGAATCAFAISLYQILSVAKLTVLQGVFLVLCTLCFGWIALGTSSAILGFVSFLRSGWASPVTPASATTRAERTALLFPVYHEDVARIAATIEAIANELVALGAEQRFDAFVLSDTRTGDIRARELRAVRFLRRQLRSRVSVYYRARSQNLGKKAGNIADWVRRFGGAYQSFIILDADSIMSGTLLVHLQSVMASNSKVGLIQTVPRLVGASTLFARLQQFAVAFYGPVVAAGFAAWHQQSGNYWGHNAIVRTRAFAQAAGLPELSGGPPLGGQIQSHDFVEAAFLRRAGWEVRMFPHLHGSYEGSPPTLVDLAIRDRRWAQGNLQHLRIVGASGLPWVSRLHLAMGTYAYLASALWALSLAVGVALAVQSAYTLPVYFPDTKTLFPIWPVIDPVKALYLFVGTITIVVLPKALGVVVACVCSHPDAGRPGLGRLLLGAFVETLASILITPVLMLTQTSAVIEILRGKDSGWSVQRRAGEPPELSELVRFHVWHQLVGIGLATVCAMVSVFVIAWMSPIILGLLLSLAISHFTSQASPAWLAKALATPEDIRPPAIVAAVDEAFPRWAALLVKKRPGIANA